MKLHSLGLGSLLVFTIASFAVPAPPLAGAKEAAAEPVVSQEAELAAAAIKLPDGFQISTVASEPNLANPVAFCFDPAGRIFVAETHRVHHGTEDNRNHMDWLDDDLAARTVADRRAYIERRMADRLDHYTESSELVRLLEDRDRDGRYEHSSIFSTGYAEIEDGAAAGLFWIDGKLLFTCIPSLWELRDADGDGQAEQRQALASGFGVHFALFGHDLHGLCQGPDGKIYFSIGDRGLHVETPEGVLSNPDSGAVLRCNPDGSQLEFFATGLRNPQELAFNEFGDLFTVDNNSDSGDRARLVYIPEGMETGWRMSYQYLPDRGPFNREKIWHTQNDEQPASIMPPLAHISDGPSGLAYYPGTGLPASCDGAFFLADFRGAPSGSGLRKFHVEPQGATYRLASDAMFAEGILATDCGFGPDGGLYVADWIQGWEGTGKGRIHRIVSDDAKSTAQRHASQQLLANVPQASSDELILMLGNANMQVRAAAQHRLVAIGGASFEPLATAATSKDAPLLARIHAIWAMGALAESDPARFAALAPLCDDQDAEIRNQTARTLGRAGRASPGERPEWGNLLLPLLADESPRVRASAAISLGKLAHRPALAALLQMARENDDRDPVLRHAAAFGLAGSQSAEGLVAAADGATPTERLAIVVALGRQKSPLVAKLLTDDAPRVALESARVIWDKPLPEAYGPLAAIIDMVPSANEPLLRRSLAANSAEGASANLQSVVRCALRSDLSPAMREHAWGLVSQWPAPSSRDPVHGQWRPVAPRSAEETVAALQPLMEQILAASDADPTGVVVAVELGAPGAAAKLLDVVENEAHDAQLRARAVAALGSADDPIVEQALDAGLTSENAEVRSAASKLMSRRFPAKAVEHLRSVAESATLRERQAALQTLATIDLPAAHATIGQWMERVEQGECPTELVLEVIEAAAKSPDAEVVERRARYAEQLSAVAEPAAAYAACLEGGDAARGEKIFTSSEALSCRRCHSVSPGELLVGPSLAEVGGQRTRQEILESIVKPNAKIVEGFQTTAMLLDTGTVVTGLVRREDDSQAVLIDADGKEIVVDLDGVEDRVKGLSAMPEDLMKHMTPRDLRDLVEYLSSLRAATADGEAPANEGHGGEAAKTSARDQNVQ